MSNEINQLYLPGPVVDRRYGWSAQTRWRRQNDPELGFPQPMKIKGRTLFKLSELEEWERRMAATTTGRAA